MSDVSDSTRDCWLPLDYDSWKDTYATLHMWMQIVGKVALALAPRLNHSWGVALQFTSRGLTTYPLAHGVRSFTIEFDFLAHRLVILASDGVVRLLPLAPMTVADFYKSVMNALAEMKLPVKIWPMAVEIPNPIRLDTDTVHHSYDAEAATRAWRVLSQVERVLNLTRPSFIGKCSPVHFFWGGFDVAVTRFSGRLAPPREGPAFMREAYSHEVISHGFWPGSAPLFAPAFYAYAVPEPAGLKEAAVQPPAAYYHREMGEFVLPYEAVRTSADPDRAIQLFVSSTYEQAATLAKWDRAGLEAQPITSGR